MAPPGEHDPSAVYLMTTALLLVLPACGALSEQEVRDFVSKSHTERNTDTQGTVNIEEAGVEYYRLRSNGIPDHSTGTFPGRGNPNHIVIQDYNQRFSKSPEVADEPTCLPKGPIGFAVNGVPLFNPYNRYLENAVEGHTAEVFDACKGHPNERGGYHYHQNPICVHDEAEDELVGVALDGFPIYSPKTVNGSLLTSDDLDQCHGHIVNGTYRYRVTSDFPYIMGCFKGKPSPDIAQRRLDDEDCIVIPRSSAVILRSMSTFLTAAISVFSVWMYTRY